jgi:hypothetical protein
MLIWQITYLNLILYYCLSLKLQKMNNFTTSKFELKFKFGGVVN